MRICEPEFALENVWHVLDVLEGSPAESAGLVPYGDWIIGWSGGVLGAEGDFYDVVEAVCRNYRRYRLIQLINYLGSISTSRFGFMFIHTILSACVLLRTRFPCLIVTQYHPGSCLGPKSAVGRRGLAWLCVRVGLVCEQNSPMVLTRHSFGLLHRIPPLPDDRQPGTLPSELQDSTGFEEHEDMLYVPADATSDQLDLEFHTDTYDQHQPIYSPPHTHDYSYSYSNRGVALDRQLPSSTIPEEYEETENYPHSSRSSLDSGSDRHYHHHSYDHDRHIGVAPTSTLSSSLASDVNSNGDSRS